MTPYKFHHRSQVSAPTIICFVNDEFKLYVVPSIDWFSGRCDIFSILYELNIVTDSPQIFQLQLICVTTIFQVIKQIFVLSSIATRVREHLRSSACHRQMAPLPPYVTHRSLFYQQSVMSTAVTNFRIHIVPPIT